MYSPATTWIRREKGTQRKVDACQVFELTQQHLDRQPVGNGGEMTGQLYE